MNKNLVLSKTIPIIYFFSFISVLFRSKLIGSIAFIFLIVSLMYLNAVNKKNCSITKKLIIIQIPFYISIFGVFFSDDINLSAKYIFRLLPIFILPLLLFCKEHNKIIKDTYLYISNYFPIFLITLLYVYLGFVFYLYLHGLGNYFLYKDFAEIVTIHTTYLSLLINISYYFLLNTKFENLKIKNFLIFSHLFFLVLISSKISFIPFFLVSIFYFKKSINWKYIPIFIGLLFLFLIPLKYRLLEKKLNVNESVNTIELVKSFVKNDLKYRFQLWKSNIESVKKKNIFFGYGTYAKDDYRLELYKKHLLTEAYNNQYNAHNQFVEIYYSYGLIGLLFFLIHVFYFIYRSFKVDFKLFLLYCILLIYFLTESILIRNLGILVYTYVIIYIQSQFETSNNING